MISVYFPAVAFDISTVMAAFDLRFETFLVITKLASSSGTAVSTKFKSAVP